MNEMNRGRGLKTYIYLVLRLLRIFAALHGSAFYSSLRVDRFGRSYIFKCR